jgi:hypothetical protein
MNSAFVRNVKPKCISHDEQGSFRWIADGARLIISIRPERCLISDNSGLKLANAFGVFV